MKKGFVMIPNEAADFLDKNTLFAYVWLVRHSVMEDGKRIVKTSYRDLANEWDWTYITVFRTLSKLDGFITIHNGRNQYQPTTIEVHNVTANVTPNVTASVTAKKPSKHLKTKTVQQSSLFDDETPNVTASVTAPVTASRVYKNDNIIISCLNTIKTKKEYNYFVIALERIGETANSMSDKSDAEAERLMVKIIQEYYNLMVETYHSRMSKIKAGISNQRLSFLKARVGEYGLPQVLEVIDKATQSPFLNGGGNRAFIASFEWIMRPNNFPKVLEGYYNREKQNIQNNGNTRQTTTPQQRAAEAAAIIARLAAQEGTDNNPIW